MSSFKDLVRKVNSGEIKTVSASGQKQSSNNDEEEEKKNSSFRDLVKQVNDGTIKVSSRMQHSDVDNWYKSVSQTGKRVYDYLSKDGYKTPDVGSLDEIATFLSQAGDVGQYIRANKGAFSNYDEVMQNYTDTVSYLRNLQSGLQSSNDFYSQFETEDQYNFWKDHSTVESRQQWYADKTSRLEQLRAEIDSDSSDMVNKRAEELYQTGKYANRLHAVEDAWKEIEDEIASLETEINNYKRGNYNEDGQYYGSKTVDDYYHISQRPDFDVVSANRDFGNATKEDFDKWYYQTYGGVMTDPETGKEIEGSRVGPGAADTSKESLKINDPLGFYLQAKEYRDSGEARYNSFGVASREYDKLMTDASTGAWDELTDTEIGIYYVIRNEQGHDAAMKFLKDMEVELNKRATMAANKSTAELYDEANLLGKVMLNAASVAAGTLSAPWVALENAIATTQGEEINPYSTTKAGMHFRNTVRSEAEADFNANGGKIPILTKLTGFTLGDFYQSGMSILDSYAAIGIGGKLGGALLATGAANSEAIRLYEQGASTKQIALGSAAAGAAEMIFESISIDKLINLKDATTVGQLVKNVLIQGGIEASEEGFTEIANIITNSIIMGNQSDWAKLVEEYDGDKWQAFLSKVQDVVNAGIGGFISGTGSAGVPSVVSAGANAIRQQVQYANTGKAINYADGGVDALLSLANEVAGASEGKTQKALNKGIASVGKNAGNIKVGKLYDTVKTANKLANASQNKADIVKSLTRKGFKSGTANDIAEALIARYNGKELSKAQTRLLESVENSTVVQDAISNILDNTSSTVGQRSQNIRDFDKDISAGIISRSFGLDTKAAKQAVEKQFTPAGTYETSVDGKSFRTDTGEIVDIKGIASIRNGEMLLDIGDGKTINAKDVSYATEDQALIYEAVANLGDIVDATTANKLVRQYKGGNAMAFARDMAQAYTYGFYGLHISELTGKTSSATAVTQEQNDAYNLGSQYRNVKDQADKAKARATKAAGVKGVYFRSKDGTVTDFRSYEKDSNIVLKDVQKTAIDVMERMSKIMGVRFNVYESWVENGKRYYLDENGVKTEGNPNGFYDPRTGEIYIDLAAGNDYQGTMLFTVAHELTHFMRQWSPEHFTKIARIVFKHGGMKGNVSALVAAKQAKAKAKGKPISYDTAMEEAVADGMETILKDGKVVEFMADVKQTDHTAWEKIKEWFKNLAKLLKEVVSAYSAHSAQTLEGARVAAFAEDLLRQIEQIYAEGAVAAGENYQAAEVQKNTTQESGVKYSLKEYSEQQKRNWAASKRIVLYQSAEQFAAFIQDSITNKTMDQKMYFGAVSSDLAKRILADTGVNVENYNLSLGSYEVRKILKDHGNEDTESPRGQRAIVADDFAHIVDVVLNPTKITLSEDTYMGKPAIMFTGEHNGRMNVIAVVSDKRLDLFVQTIFVNVKKGNLATPTDDQASANTPEANNGTVSSGNNIHPDEPEVKNESVESMDVVMDKDTESVAPAVLKSERTWKESDYVQEREKAAEEIAKAIGVSKKKAKAYIDSVNSIAKMIADDRVRLDYFSSPGRSSFIGNVEYGGSFDFSTLCKKRRLLTGTFTAIQKALPNTALTADEILDIRNRMKEKGLEVSCGLCYVEGSRANMGQFAKEFLRLYKQYYPDAWQPNMADVNTPDGIEWVRINHPECYEQYEYFWNHYGTLKEGDKNLFASQQKPKLYQLHTEYKGEILDKFNDDDNVEEKNLNGGIRLQSFSDFEIVHLLDTMQIIMDMSRVGLAGQAYTKVPDFAWALGDTGLKINLSLIAKGVDENGRLIFDDVEGMPIADAMKLRERYSKNVGTILVAFNDEQLMAAMADDRVDYIIPFHRSQWKKSQYGAMGLPAKTKDYTFMQNEKFIKPQYHEYRGRMVKDKATNYMPNEYWDFSKSGKENAEAYLEMCARNNKRPKFYKLLQNNGDGSYSLKADGSTDGYWKLLIDFKMYDNDGNGSPQMPVKPDFNMDEATRMLNEYSGGHSNFPVAQGIVDDFVQEYKDSHKGTMFSNRDLTEDPLYPDTERERSAFNRGYINKTNGLKRNTEKDIIINTHLYTYHVRAVGRSYKSKPYLGEILKKVPIDKAITVDDVREEVINGTYRATEEDYIPYEEAPYVSRRNDWRTPSLRERLAAEGYDYLLDEPYEGDTDGDREQGGRNRKSSKVKLSDRDDSILTERQTLHQDRADESVSNRSLLANAFEGIAKPEERQKVQEYRERVDLINAEERKLRELNEKIKELSFAKGPRDAAKIRTLRDEATKTANRISIHDKQLLRLEASKPLQDVLNREKEKVRKKEKQKGKEALEAYREETMNTQRELVKKWQESRKKGIDSRNRTAMRHKIKNVVNELNQYLLRGTKDRHVPIELQKAVAEALDAVNMDTVGAEERIAKLQDELLKAKTPEKIQEISRKIDHVREMGDKMNGRLQKLKDAYDQFVNSDDPLIANAHDEVISNKLQSVIDSIGNTPLRDMTLAQLEDVYDMYRMVLTTIRNANKAFKAKKSESVSALAGRVMEEVRAVGGKKGKSLAMLNWIKRFGWDNMKPVYAFEHIGSGTFTEIFNNVRAGEDVWAVDVTEARAFYLDKSKKHGYDTWDFEKRYQFESTSGMEFELDLEQIMSLYAYSKRDQAADHLKKGGIVFDDSIEVREEVKVGPFRVDAKVEMTDATAYNISEATLADIVSKLSKEQKAFVDEMQDYLSSVMGAKGNEVSLEMYGIKLFKEKFYFPLKSAHQFMAKAKEQQKGEVKIKNSGFSKETVQKASNPIVLTPFMNVWSDHVNEMSMYHAFVLPMEDFYRVYNYKTPTSETTATESVEMFIQNAYGKGATGYIDQLLKDLNGGARTDSTTGIINKMMGLFKKGAVFASLSVVVQQPSAVARAAALVDTKYFIGPKVDHKRHKAMWDEVKRYAPVAIIKEMGYFDTNMGKSTQDFIMSKEYSGFKEKMSALVKDSGYRDEVLSKAPALADEIAWCGIWEAVKREIKANNPGMDVKAEAFLKKAGERFTEVIVKTQVYDSVLSRSGLMRSKDTGMKMATAFMAEPTTSINMIADALLQGKRGNRKYCRAAIGAVIASQILNSILVSFVYAGRDDDEDETYVEKYIGTLTGEILDSLNPASYIPFIKDIQSIVKGYDVERSDMAVISDLWNAIQNLKKDNVSVYRKVEGFAGSVAQIFGLPVKNIMRDARGIYQTIMSFMNGQHTTGAGIGYAVKSAAPKWLGGGDVSNQNQLYEAYLSGDKNQIARVEGRYKDQTAINSAIRKALRENDPRIHAAAVAREAGNIAEYTRIAKEIIGEKHFSQDNVVAAINAEINAMGKGETTSSVPKVSGLYKAEDFAVAISKGDQAMANAIKVDIVQTAQKNGKSQKEAEKSFNSSATAACKELFQSGEISERQAIDALAAYCGRTNEEAVADVQYWVFKQDYPDVYADDAWFDKYFEDVADSGIEIDVYMEYRNLVKGISGEDKKERKMDVINSLSITSAQKDALYYAEGWAASKLYEAPWH